MTQVLIGLGSNLGDRERYILNAWEEMKKCRDIQQIAFSRFYETVPLGGPANQPMYLNAACVIQTRIIPVSLLKLLQEIEKSLGRERVVHHGPRTIDLDILLYGNEIHSDVFLTIPHPRMHEREFVLKPSMEIAPDFIHPVYQKTLSELYQLFTGSTAQNQ